MNVPKNDTRVAGDLEVQKMKVPIEVMKYILATDVGSTTTKARFFQKIKGEWRYVASGEAPTTVEAPYEDVTAGVLNAVREVEELTKHNIISIGSGEIIVPNIREEGVDLYCTTSSAGGGLQMLVWGVINSITAESANRAALGAGAIVMEVLAVDDNKPAYQKIKRVRVLRPDMILVAGGTDGGTISHVVEIAEHIKAADPQPRFGASYLLPIVYAGNKNASSQVKSILTEKVALTIVGNLRPILEVEQTQPARNAIHEEFMEHVMSHAPGYLKLMDWADIDILPTPAGEGIAMQLISRVNKSNVLGVGLGGATTNIYSIFEGRFVRSVSANLGMSYSIMNVLKESGLKNIIRWLPFDLDTKEIINRLGNKMIRPTTIPQTLQDLIIEHAVAREALRLGLEHHKTIATRLKGVAVQRTLDTVFDQALEETYIKMMDFDMIVGTGGLLSHAPRPVQSFIILSDAFQPEGVTRLYKDSVFMMPHLGVLSTVHPKAAWEIFDKDCLVRLGTIIAPVGRADKKDTFVEVDIEMPDGKKINKKLNFGEIIRIPLSEEQQVKTIISPCKQADVGSGVGKKLQKTIAGGKVGIVIDARGRPLILPKDENERKETITNWAISLDLYSKDIHNDSKM